MFDVHHLRQQFPALRRTSGGQPVVYLDGPGGTQVPQRVIDAMVHYLTTCNANHGGLFATSQESDGILANAHEAVADLLNASSPAEVVFGPNMTTLTLQVTRAIARTLRPGDEVLVTRLDHDANVTPWVLAARETAATVGYVDIHPEDCTLDLEDLGRHLGPRTRWLALTCASNAVGTINDVRTMVRWAHAAGARVFLDAVHYAPHGPMDVQEWDCDLLACSAYKFFGPHVGVLYGKRELLTSLPAYKLRPVPETLPDRWMTGTQNHEGLAGVAAAIDYLASIGVQHPECQAQLPTLTGRRLQIRAGMLAIRDYEIQLARQLLTALARRPRFQVWGITEPDRHAWRVPTISITLADRTPEQIAEHLAARQIYVWNGNMYALQLSERLGLEERGGVLRIGLVHYNTAEEVDRLVHALDAL
ncbi:MAG: cysteine desulfurase-like protein [Gemmataceae bacterium]|nr:cysteine desulfurase-like protein [Gemmataceae bacterium]